MEVEPVDYNLNFKYQTMNHRTCLLSAMLILAIVSKAQSISIDKKVDDDTPKSSISPEAVKMDPALSVPLTVVHDLTIFPPIDKLVKHAILLDPRPNETLYRVEIYAVKSQEVDNCNKHYLIGDFELKTLEGHGYPYYIFNSNTQIISTKMGCGDNITKIKNVPSGKTELVKYISALPLVVYAPKDIEIKYKIWKQDPKELDARSF